MNRSTETSPRSCASELLETVPHLMRVIRTNVRSQAGPELSMPQLRSLAFVGRNEGAMVSDVAAFLGLTLPAASKLVESLVVSKLLTRVTHTEDRRRVSLGLTRDGRARYETVQRTAREFLASKMRHLSPDERETVFEAMKLLRTAFADAPDEEGKK